MDFALTQLYSFKHYKLVNFDKFIDELIDKYHLVYQSKSINDIIQDLKNHLGKQRNGNSDINKNLCKLMNEKIDVTAWLVELLETEIQ